MSHNAGLGNGLSSITNAPPAPAPSINGARNACTQVATFVEWGGDLIHNTTIQGLDTFFVRWFSNSATGFWAHEWSSTEYSINRLGASDRIKMSVDSSVANGKKFFQFVDLLGGGSWIYVNGKNFFGESDSLLGSSADNAAQFQFQTRMTYIAQVVAKSGAKNSQGLFESGICWTNDAGALTYNLTTVGIAFGVWYEFAVTNVLGITVKASAGDTITFGLTTTASGGSINSVVVGSSIRIMAVSANKWVAMAMLGTWT